MSQLVVTHAPDGTIREWRYVHDADYDPASDETVFPDTAYQPRDLIGRRVAVDAATPTLERDPDWVPLAELRATIEQGQLSPAEEALYRLLYRVAGDDLYAQEQRERQFAPGPGLADGWRADPTRGAERD